MEMVKAHENAVGIIAQSRINNDQALNFVQLTPGVQLHSKEDGLGQTYNTPEEAILNKGADIIIVGRGILNSDNRLDQAEIYRNLAWQSLIARISL